MEPTNYIWHVKRDLREHTGYIEFVEGVFIGPDDEWVKHYVTQQYKSDNLDPAELETTNIGVAFQLQFGKDHRGTVVAHVER